jgi:pantoate--beta-alanine ligase
MIVTEHISVLQEKILKERQSEKTIVLIPTMGFLHEGHLSMVQAVRQDDEDCEKICIIMSIFVNPLQFGPNEDFERYPRNLARDIQLASQAGVDLLFVPSVEEMYPEGKSLTTISVGKITEGLCGASRPGHFNGVATVVSKLFNIVLPDVAFFGQKDFQQYVVIKQMVKDLNIPVKVYAAPTVREADGLAMSSRNAYLSLEERRQAPVLYQSLQEAKELILRGERDSETIRAIIAKKDYW